MHLLVATSGNNNSIDGERGTSGTVSDEVEREDWVDGIVLRIDEIIGGIIGGKSSLEA